MRETSLASFSHERKIETNQQALRFIQCTPWDIMLFCVTQDEEAVNRKGVITGQKTRKKTDFPGKFL